MLSRVLRAATSSSSWSGGPDHPWPSVIRASAYDRFGSKRETQLTLIEPLTVEMSADTSVVGGTIRHAARLVCSRPEVAPLDIP